MTNDNLMHLVDLKYRTRAIITLSWILTRVLKKKLLKKKEIVFKNVLKIMQAAAYNGARKYVFSIHNTYDFIIV